MVAALTSVLLGILGKLMASEFIEFVLLECAQILADKTDNKYDDEVVAKIREVLGKK